MKEERREEVLDEHATLRAVLIAIVRSYGAVAITRSQLEEAKSNPELHLDARALPGDRTLVLRVVERPDDQPIRKPKTNRRNRP